MKKVIHHIRRQPEHVRRHILHVITLVFAVILGMLWIYSLGTGLASSEPKAKIQDELQPFSILKDNIVDGYNSLGE